MPLVPPPTRAPAALHPLHATLLAFPIALFPAALLADITYLNSSEMQWSNFAAWLNAGALVFGGLVLLWGLVSAARGRMSWAYPVLLAVTWVAGLVNAFHHSRDGWSSVGTTGLVLSIVSAVAVLIAGWLAFATLGLGRRA